MGPNEFLRKFSDIEIRPCIIILKKDSESFKPDKAQIKQQKLTSVSIILLDAHTEMDGL